MQMTTSHISRCRKAFNKVQYLFMIKALRKVGVEGGYHKIVNIIDEKPTANIILNK